MALLRLTAVSLCLAGLIGLTPPPTLAATCTGAANCRACKNCRYCGHCAKRGGTCGMCRSTRREKQARSKTGLLLTRLERLSPTPVNAKPPEDVVYEFVDQYKRLRAEVMGAWSATERIAVGDGYGNVVARSQQSERNLQLLPRLDRFANRVFIYNTKTNLRCYEAGVGWKYESLLCFVWQATEAMQQLLRPSSEYLLGDRREVYLRVGSKFREACDLLDAEINDWSE